MPLPVARGSVGVADRGRWRRGLRFADASDLRFNRLTLGAIDAPAEIDGFCHLFVAGVERQDDCFFEGDIVFANADRRAIGA